MALVRFLHLKEPVVEWTLALALSFAIDGSVAGILLYAGKWSPTGTLMILIGLSIGGALLQFVLLLPRASTRVISGKDKNSAIVSLQNMSHSRVLEKGFQMSSEGKPLGERVSK